MVYNKLMRPGAIKKSWQGEETPGVIPYKQGQRIIVVHRCKPW